MALIDQERQDFQERLNDAYEHRRQVAQARDRARQELLDAVDAFNMYDGELRRATEHYVDLVQRHFAERPAGMVVLKRTR